MRTRTVLPLEMAIYPCHIAEEEVANSLKGPLTRNFLSISLLAQTSDLALLFSILAQIVKSHSLLQMPKRAEPLPLIEA